MTTADKDLRIGSRGKRVNEVHIALRKLGHVIHENEFEKKYYGKTTGKAVIDF